ncbi:MAG TPA: hypothetical protein VGP47_06335 [Parachlamydiaceae bacterium]|nr:hypothetical protein [Parachlamydiaceae bacterium]
MVNHELLSDNELVKKYLPLKMEKFFYKKLSSEKQERVKLKIVEFLKYIVLSQYTAGPIPFSKEIDEIWHIWILQTRQYQELMELLPIDKFCHHCSNAYYDEGENEIEVEKEINRKVSFLMSYVHNFGEFKEETLRFWPMAFDLYHLHGNCLTAMHHYIRSLPCIDIL